MNPPKLIKMEIDVESLRTLRSLINSAQVCLEGLDARIRKELEVIGVAKALAEKASQTLAGLIDLSKQSNQ
jgi:hypothetical protein